MKNIYLTYGKRTPIGKIRGALAHIRPDDLLAFLFQDFLQQHFFDPTLIDDIIVGCANQAGEDNRNIARMSALLGGMPFSVPATTINRLCGSGLDAVIDAWARMQANLCDAILVGGIESMSRAPFVFSKAESPFAGNQKLYDSTLGWRFPNSKMEQIFPLLSMGETAEVLAAKYHFTRQQQDQFALSSHQKALAAQSQHAFATEIIPIKTKTTTLLQDEGPRTDTSLEKLSKLPAIFRTDGTITAGNASGLSDGAALLMLANEKFVRQHQLQPLAKITAVGIKGLHPSEMGLGPVVAITELCRRYQKKITDFQIIEINEAFAVQVLACMQELQLDPFIVNPQGGAIALGHPLGMSGARLAITLAHRLQANPSIQEVLASLCVGVGQGVALALSQP